MNQLSTKQNIFILSTMPRLSYLNARFNLIRSIPNENHQKYEMKILNLSFNTIRSLKSSAFYDFPSLIAILLQHNQITLIEVKAF